MDCDDPAVVGTAFIARTCPRTPNSAFAVVSLPEWPPIKLDFDLTTFETPIVFVRIGNILLIIAMLAATNGQWAVLQSVAWTTMLAGNLRHDSFTAAVQCTFDGKHPCRLCKAIAASSKSEKKTEFAAAAQKIEFLPMTGIPVFIAPSQFQLLSGKNNFAALLPQKPPTPPPRGCFA